MVMVLGWIVDVDVQGRLSLQEWEPLYPNIAATESTLILRSEVPEVNPGLPSAHDCALQLTSSFSSTQLQAWRQFTSCPWQDQVVASTSSFSGTKLATETLDVRNVRDAVQANVAPSRQTNFADLASPTRGTEPSCVPLEWRRWHTMGLSESVVDTLQDTQHLLDQGRSKSTDILFVRYSTAALGKPA
ncbi:hypothetical protein WMY93_032535 [Mugilogobius chulae]|uniref:Uncharacterized protein n=1 Tax=Mugilogobius chulae TaxID=88201 RepID=A0AAW0ML14_9GOBI